MPSCLSPPARGDSREARAVIAATLRARLELALGRRIVSAVPVAGGDINQAFELGMANGEAVFLKINENAPPRMFEHEAHGLAFLREARALRTPDVLAFSEEDERPGFLLLQFVRAAKPGRHFEEALGRGLAALHCFGAPSFGLPESNFIGRLAQSNAARLTWLEFYRDERLRPQLSMAARAGRAPPALLRNFERLFAKLPELVGGAEPPSRLHGDLWAGNLHIDEQGAPCLIDPAVYGGHREIDLSMMKLFGGFGARVFSAYAEAFPLSPGHGERVALYQLYPLLVHLNLFGGSYLGALQSSLARYI